MGLNCDFGTGNDGDLLVSTSGIIVNDYVSVVDSLPSGSKTISLSDTSMFSDGDEILLIQMQGETPAGRYEFHIISDVGPSSIELQESIADDYVSSSALQIVRVPNYNQVTFIWRLHCSNGLEWYRWYCCLSKRDFSHC